MRVLNIALNGNYTDGFSYHENLLPKYHKVNGAEVFVIASEYVFNEKGETVKASGSHEYIDENGIHIIRLQIKGDKYIEYKLKRFERVYETIESIKPDIIFCHAFQFLDVLEVVRYRKEHPEVKLYIDSHADYSNSASNIPSKYFLHGVLWRYCAYKALPLTEKFYGVLPARVDFLIERYRLPKKKVELLMMGADDELVEKARNPVVIKGTRKDFGIEDDDFLIVTGGKIDIWKKQTLLLMDAVNNLENTKVKLLVFGSVVPELKEEIDKRCSARVKYIGWLESKDSYPIFAACQLAVFPGRHSVFWEQVCGQGIPMVVKKWNGTTHVDCGGNVLFLENDKEVEISSVINTILADESKYFNMKMISEMTCMKVFSYKELAKRSII